MGERRDYEILNMVRKPRVVIFCLGGNHIDNPDRTEEHDRDHTHAALQVHKTLNTGGIRTYHIQTIHRTYTRYVREEKYREDREKLDEQLYMTGLGMTGRDIIIQWMGST